MELFKGSGGSLGMQWFYKCFLKKVKEVINLKITNV